ncbi:MAG: CBS domain-containing protein [bacterium]
MSTVREMLASKGSEVHTIDPQATVFDAVQLMTEKNVGSLLVTRQDAGKERICGIVSERDYLRHVVLKGRSSRSTPVKDIMTKKVIFGEPVCSVNEVLNIMTEKRIRHLPIVVDDDLQGIVSIGDCTKALIEKQEVEIKYLKEYMADGYPGPNEG